MNIGEIKRKAWHVLEGGDASPKSRWINVCLAHDTHLPFRRDLWPSTPLVAEPQIQQVLVWRTKVARALKGLFSLKVQLIP